MAGFIFFIAAVTAAGPGPAVHQGNDLNATEPPRSSADRSGQSGNPVPPPAPVYYPPMAPAPYIPPPMAPPPPPPPPPASASAASTGGAESAKPIGSPGAWVTQYPPEALAEEVEGDTRFKVTINKKGRATSCAVTRSSGSQILDTEACRQVLTNGKFRPARDRNGRAVTGEYQSTVRWRIPLD
jgi:protein TonB